MLHNAAAPAHQERQPQRNMAAHRLIENTAAVEAESRKIESFKYP